MPSVRINRLRDCLQSGRFAVTAEIVPPVSCDAADLIAKVRPLRGIADAVNVTDGAGARLHMSALAAATILLQNGVESVLQMTCRDSNRIGLQSGLLGAAALGIENLLLLRGDDPSVGDEPDAKPVFDLDTTTLLRIARPSREASSCLRAAGLRPGPFPHRHCGFPDRPSCGVDARQAQGQGRSRRSVRADPVLLRPGRRRSLRPLPCRQWAGRLSAPDRPCTAAVRPLRALDTGEALRLRPSRQRC